MADKFNMIMNMEQWNGISKTRDFRQVCAGYAKEGDFWEFQEYIPNLESDMIFLDVGCGPGRIASYVAPKVKSYYGIDIHPELISIAKEHYKDYSNVTFLKSNGHNIDVFESDFFDYVHERLLFIHIKKEIITEYLLDCCRVLKKKGFLYVPDLPRFDYWVNGFTRDEISSLLLKNFSVVRIGEKSNTYQLLCVK